MDNLEKKIYTILANNHVLSDHEKSLIVKGVIDEFHSYTNEWGKTETVGKTKPFQNFENTVENDIIHKKYKELNVLFRLLKNEKNEKQEILDSISDMVIFHDLDMNIVWANKIAINNALCDKEKLIGSRCYHCFGQNETFCVDCPVIKCIETKTYVDSEITKPDNKIWRIIAHPVIDDNDNMIGVVETRRDVTEKRIAQKKLENSEERFRTLFEYSKDAIVILDPKTGIIETANNSWYKLMGVNDVGILKNKTPWDLSPKYQTNGINSKKLAIEKMSEALKNNVSEFDWEHKRIDGTAITTNIQLVKMNINGKYMLVSTVKDITETIQLASKLTKLINDLNERNKELNCLYRISELIENNSNEFEIYQKSANILAQSFKHSCTHIKIQIAQNSFYSEEYKPSEHVLAGTITSNKHNVGKIELHCSAKEHSNCGFDKEALELIQAVAERLGKYYERVEAEKRLKTMSELLDIAPSIITIHDYQGNFLYANKKCLEVHGYTLNEFLNFNVRDIDLPETAKLAETRLNQIAKEKELSFEVEHYKKNRTIIPLQIYNKEIDWEGNKAVLSIGTDISERKQFVDKLIFQSSLLEQITDMVLATDIKGNIKYVNEAQCKAMGKTLEELLLSNILLFDNYKQHDNNSLSQKQIIEKTLADGSWRGEVINIDEKSNITLIDLRTWSVKNHKNKPIAICGISTDITEKKVNDLLLKSRMRLIEYTDFFSWNELLLKTLNEIETLTKSNSSFILFNIQNNFNNPLIWSEKATLDNKQKPLQQILYQNNKLLCNCIETKLPIINNEFGLLTDKESKNVLNIINRITIVPILTGKNVAALIGIIGSTYNYTKLDVHIVSELGKLLFDIEERLQMQNKLSESEKQYRSLFENITQAFALHEMIYDNDNNPADYRFLTVNPAFERLTGLKAKDILGKTAKNILPETEHYWIDTYGKVATTGIATNYQNYSKELGKYYEVWAFSPKSGEFAVVFSDITARIMAELQLKKLVKGIEHSPTSVLITDNNGTIEYVNPHFTEVTGYLPEDVIGKNPKIFKSGKQSYSFYTELWKTLLSGKVWHGEMVNRKKNSDLYWENITITPILNEKNEITNFVSFRDDITNIKEKEVLLSMNERKLTEQNKELLAANQELAANYMQISDINKELIIAREKAEESDKLKSAFLANISHEIRTPLNGVIGFSKLLHKKNVDPQKAEQFVNIIESSAQQLLSVVNDVLDIAKIESGQITVYSEKTNINQTIRNILYLLKLSATQNKITIRENFQFIDSESNIFIDKVKFTQIITNLVNNALKYTNEGYIEVSYTINKNETIEFRVTDTGIGIRPSYHNTIFERFRQVEYGETRQYGGTGLGLSISKAFVEIMGGEIWVESEIGSGSTFIFTIPYKPVERKPLNVDKNIETTIDLNNKTILIVEDEETNMFFLSELLSNTGSTIVKAYNGIEAVNHVKENHVDLILMDIKMPKMDGITALKQIKLQKPQIPIVATTAYALSGDKEKFLSTDFDLYISKPIDRNELYMAINALIK